MKRTAQSRGKNLELRIKDTARKFAACDFITFFLIVSVVVICCLGFGMWGLPKAEAASGINKQINFQGKLVDNNGLNVADSSYTVVFSLYTTSSGGSAAWTESDSVSTSNGVFQVALGANTPFPGNVDFNSDTWYLGIKVGSDLEMTPRVRFSAVPYAFNAAALDGIVATNSATQFTITGGTNALIDLTVNGSLTLGSTIKPTASGALTVQSNGSNGLTLDTGGAAALAIGATANQITFGATNNPSYSFNGTGAFTIAGGGNNNITLGSNGGTGTVVIQPNAGGQASLLVINQGSGDILTASAGASTKFTVSNTGTVTIAASASYTGAGAVTLSSGGSSGLTLDSASGRVSVATGDFLNSGIAGTSGAISGDIWYDTTAQKFKINENGVTKTLCNLTDTGCGTGGAVTLQGAYNGGQTIDLSTTGTGLTIGTNAGTQNIVFAPNAGGQAGLVINDQGSGDIFTASSSGSTKLVLSHAGNLGVGSSAPQQGLTLGTTTNLAGEMSAPTGTTASPQQGGSLPNATYYYVVTASDGSGETIKSVESSGCTSTNAGGGQHICLVSWTGVTGASSYKIYRTTTSGTYTGSAFLTSVTALSYTDTGGVSLTSGVPPASTTAYVNNLTYSGSSWIMAGHVGIGTSSPLARLHVMGGNTGGNAAFIVDQIGTSTNDILSASAAGATKFIVHNDGSIQTAGNNATADITTITGGNGLKIVPKANSSGAGGGLTLQSGNGSGGVGGNVVIDAGTGSTNGTISIGTSNQSGLTLGRSGAATTINGSSLTLGGATGVSGAVTITSNSATALAVGPNGTTNPGLQVDASTGSAATGLKITSAAAGGGLAVAVISSGTNENLTIDAKGSGTIIIGGTSTGAVTLGRATNISGALTVTSNSATAFTVGANGSTNPVLTVNASTGSVVTGLQVLGAATGGTTALSVTDSGSNANLSIDAKGSGTITIGGTSTGNIIIGGATNGLTFSTTSGPSYAGTGRPTKKIVLSAEYPGAVLTASASASITGNLTSDASPSAITNVPGSIPTTFSYENYYQWAATALGSDQRYTVAVRVTLPKDFSAWVAGTSPYALTIDFNTAFTNTALNSLDVYIYQYGDTSSKPVAFRTAQASGTAKNWTQVQIPSTDLAVNTPTWDSSHPSAIILLTMHSTNTVNYVQIGDITLNYLASF